MVYKFDKEVDVDIVKVNFSGRVGEHSPVR